MRRPRSTTPRRIWKASPGDYDALKQDVEELQARVDEISAQAVDAQQAVIEGRAALGKTAVHEYLNGERRSRS